MLPLGVSGASAYGGSSREALEQGADLDTARDYGYGSAGLEIGTERLFGGMLFFGKGVVDDAVKSVLGRSPQFNSHPLFNTAPSIRPMPRTSPISGSFPGRCANRRLFPRNCFSGKPGCATRSSTCSAPAHTTGFAPKVEPCMPWKGRPPAARCKGTRQPKPPPRPFALGEHAGLYPRTARSNTGFRCGRPPVCTSSAISRMSCPRRRRPAPAQNRDPAAARRPRPGRTPP